MAPIHTSAYNFFHILIHIEHDQKSQYKLKRDKAQYKNINKGIQSPADENLLWTRKKHNTVLHCVS